MQKIAKDNEDCVFILWQGQFPKIYYQEMRIDLKGSLFWWKGNLVW